MKKIFVLLFSLILFSFNGLKAKCQSVESGTVLNGATLVDNNSIWKDTEGNEIRAQGGSIIKVKDLYHWIGPEISGQGNMGFNKFNRYTSTDLVNWTKQKPVITFGQKGLPFSKHDWVARPWVFFHEPTSTFVIYCEWNENKGPVRDNQIAVLTASDMEGPWVCDTVYSQIPDSLGNKYTMGDLGGFQDEDGNAYLMYTFDRGGPNKAQAIAKLSPSDYRRILLPSEGHYIAEFSASEREAAAIIKRNGVYYYFTSDCWGWSPSPTMYRTSTQMDGQWSEQKLVLTDPENNLSYQTQHDFILSITGSKETTYLYCGDRWNVCNPRNYQGTVGLYGWYPMVFNADGVPVIKGGNYLENGGDWLLNVQTGEWKNAPNN